jgi:general secretion pathway protein J
MVKADKRRGFTLIELLVAITVLAVVAVLGWRGLDSIIRSRVALTGEMEQTRGMQLAFAQMQSDCEHMIAPADIGGRKTLVADNTRLLLVRTVYAENQPSRVQVVSYRLAGGVLSRRESAGTRDLGVLDALWRSALEGTDSNAQPVVLQEGVNGMAVQQWQSDGPGWRPVDTGVSAAPVAAGAPLPPAATPTGLQVTLLPQGMERGMVKVFLLGAA